MPKHLKYLLAYKLTAQGMIVTTLVKHVATSKLKLMNTKEPI